jgi:hypothetical protein
MIRFGRANFVVIAATLSFIAVFALLLTAGRSPMSAAREFMRALALHDAATLAKLSIIGDDDEATRRKKWEKTLDRGKHYIFTYKLDSVKEIDANKALVRVMLAGNANQAGSVDEKFELTMVKVDGDWKVVVPELSRRLFPSLPQ